MDFKSPSFACKSILLFSALCILLVYLFTLAPGIFWRDSAEFVMIPFNLDIGHPAGSPTYTMLAGLLARVPIGSIAFRSNLASALMGMAAWLAMLFAAKQLARRASPDLSESQAWGIGAICIAPLMFSPGIWYWTIVAEVYSSTLALMGVTIGLTLYHQPGKKPLDNRILYTIGLLLGLGCGIHMVVILYAPAFGIYLFLTHRNDFSVKRIFFFAVAFFTGFSIFVLLPIRSLANPPFDFGNTETLPALLAHITGRHYSEVLQSFPWHRMLENLGLLAGHLVNHLTWPVVILACAGIVLCFIRFTRGAIFITLIVLGHFYLYLRDWQEDFGYLTIYFLAALFAAFALAFLLKQSVFNKSINSKAVTFSMLIAAILLGGWQAWANWEHCDRSDHALLLPLTRNHLNYLPPDALLVSYEDYVNYATVYAQSIERWREDVIHFHRAYLDTPELISQRHPDLNITPLDFEPYYQHRFLQANAKTHTPFWDMGWEKPETIDLKLLAPHGRFMQVIPEPVEDIPSAAKRSRELLQTTDGPILNDPNFNEHDWTALDVIARLYSVRAQYYFDVGNIELAEKALHESLKYRPEFPPTLGRLGALESLKGNTKSAAKYMDHAIALDPLDTNLLNNRIRLAFQEKDVEKAMDLVKKSLAINKMQPEAWYYLALADYENKHFQSCINNSAKGLKASKGKLWQSKLKELIALSFFQLGEFQKARPLFIELAKDQPDNPRFAALVRACDEKMSNLR